MKKKMMLLISILQIAALSACGRTADDVNLLETGIAQGEQSESTEEESVGEETAVEEGTGEESAVEAEREEEDDMTGNEPAQNPRVLIAYFSQPTDVDVSDLDAVAGASVIVREGEVAGSTTEYAARIIQETVGGDLFRIETVDAYPSDYDELVAQARAEKEDGFRPELAGSIENPEQYDTIILGFPSWIGDMPMPVYSFLEENDFGAKTIIPFVTHGGSGFGSTVEAISRLQLGAFVSGDGLSVPRGDLADGEGEIRQWAEDLGLNTGSQAPESSSHTVASKDAEKFAASDLPPTYFCYGTRDPFVGEFEACIAALQEAGGPVEVDVLEGRPHGYGYTEGWIPAYAEWLGNVFADN